jgi:hypothetical protein
MRKLLLVAVLLAVFLGGYYAGRQPGSPDILAAAARICERVADDVNRAGAWLQQGASAPSKSSADQPQPPVKARSDWSEEGD